MVATSTIYTQVEPPPVVPRPYGLFSVASPSSPSDPTWQVGVSWMSAACSVPATTVDACIDGSSPAALTPEVTCLPVQQAKPVTVYVFDRQPITSFDVGEAQVGAMLEAAEQRGIEEHLWARLIAGAVMGPAATTVIAALAYVETKLGALYGGTGVIHMGAYAATLLGTRHLIQQGAKLVTTLGTPVVVGSGYQEGADGTTATIFGTGAMAIRRSAIQSNPIVNSQNDFLVLAQRTYVVGWDCVTVGRVATPAV